MISYYLDNKLNIVPLVFLNFDQKCYYLVSYAKIKQNQGQLGKIIFLLTIMIKRDQSQKNHLHRLMIGTFQEPQKNHLQRLIFF